MPPFSIQPRALRPSGALLRAGYATQKPRNPAIRPPGPRGSVYRTPPPVPLRRPGPPSDSPAQSSDSSDPSHNPSESPAHTSAEKKSSVDSISNALRDTTSQDNNLLSPIHIPEDPDGVLNEKHPATSILANSAIVVTRQLELMNVMLGFEQANKYVIMDPQGQHIGYMAERELGMGNMMARQMFSTHRSFTTHVFDKHEKEVLRFHRPFSWISSRIGVYDPWESDVQSSTRNPPTATPGPLSTEINQHSAQVSQLPMSDMRIIGESQQQWAPLRRKYNLFLYRGDTADHNNPQLSSGDLPLSSSKDLQLSASNNSSSGQFGQFAYVDEPFLSWDFSLLSADSRLIGSVNRNFVGFGRELFTDTGVYALRMDSAGLAQEPGHIISKSGRKAEPAAAGMTLDQRAIMLATAVSVDFDYFSRKSGAGGGMGFMPLWFPGMGGGGAAAGEAGAEAGAMEGAGGAAGGVARGAGGAGEGAAVGAGSVAGYEAMQRGAYGDDASPTAGQYGAGQSPPQQPGQVGEGEDVWGKNDDPWGGNQGGGAGGGGAGGSGDGGGGGDGEGGWFDGLSDFFDE